MLQLSQLLGAVTMNQSEWLSGRAICEAIPVFSEQWVRQLHDRHTKLDITFNCCLKDPERKDIDNLAKIPIDAIFSQVIEKSGI